MKNTILKTITFAAVIAAILIPVIGWRTESDPVPILVAELFPIGWLWLFCKANGSDALNKVFK